MVNLAASCFEIESAPSPRTVPLQDLCGEREKGSHDRVFTAIYSYYRKASVYRDTLSLGANPRNHSLGYRAVLSKIEGIP